MTSTMLLHVGYPKTATTWLQRVLFSHHTRFATPWPTEGNRIVEEVLWRREADFDARTVRDAFEHDAEAARAAGQVPVLSHEALVGDPVRGLYWGDAAAVRLAETFPNAHILISIREQASLAYSAWGEYVRRGGTLSLGHYLFRTGADDPGYRAFLPREYLDFAATARLYVDLFGAKKVTVLPLELLKRDPAAYAGAVLAPLGLAAEPLSETGPVYPSAPRQALELQRRLNRLVTLDASGGPAPALLRRVAERTGRLVRRTGLADKGGTAVGEIRARFGSYFAETNRRLQNVVEYDLASLGYLV